MPDPNALPPRQPTAEECTANAEIRSDNGRLGYACWYPQMGGYVGKAVAEVDEDGCIDVYVWHDGTFPFDGQCQNCGDDRQPVVLHLSDPGDFVQFGKWLSRLSDEAEDHTEPTDPEADHA